MTRFFRRAASATIALSLVFALTACSGGTAQSGTQSAESSQSEPAQSIPDVDRSGRGNFPEVIGKFGEDPEIKAGSGEPMSQLSVKTLYKGQGPKISTSDSVVVNYQLALWDGTKIESSFESGNPASFSLDQVIAGWKYGLASQHVGDRVEMVIPSQWGYGKAGTGTIPPDSTLVFVVDILNSSKNIEVNEDDSKNATATNEPLPEGVTVSGKAGEEPKLAIAPTAAVPQEGSVVTVFKGAGAQIKEGDTVVYRAVVGRFGDEGEPQSFWDNDPLIIDATQGQFVGATLGSRQVITQTQPSSDSSAAMGIVWVIDLIGVLAPNVQ